MPNIKIEYALVTIRQPDKKQGLWSLDLHMPEQEAKTLNNSLPYAAALDYAFKKLNELGQNNWLVVSHAIFGDTWSQWTLKRQESYI